jgi:Zn-dependent metalloprotease
VSQLPSVQTIVPPHILRHLVEHGDARIRARAIRSLTIRARFQGRREVLSQVRLSSPLGERYRTVFDAKEGRRLPGTLVRNEGDNPTGDPKINAVYDGLGVIYDFFHDVYGRNSLDNRGQRLIATVHFESDFDNAFWDGRQLVFGDGDGVIFKGFSSSLDVVAHELAHGVIQHDAGLDYQDQPGALNESFADVFASLVKQYHLNQDVNTADWLIGSDLLGPGIKGRGLRSLKEPGQAYDDPLIGKDPQVASFRNYINVNDDRGGVHINSGIANHAFYLVAKQLGGYAWDEAGQIWYLSLRRFQRETDFQEAASIIYQVAGELFGPSSPEQHAVQNAWEEVGVRIQTRAIRRRSVSQRAASIVSPASRSEGQSHGNGHSLSQPSGELDGIKKTLEVLRQRVDVLSPVQS